MEKQETIFRQKSVDRVNSPEQLDSYLKVTSPSVWLVLIGIIIILFGAIVWSYFGKLNTYSSVGCTIEEGQAWCYINEENGSNINAGMIVEIPSEEKSFEITSVDKKGIQIPDAYDYLQHLIGVTSKDYVFSIMGLCDLPNGYYAARVATESVSPLEFILN